jgi:HD-GYP domain-containing protein (c-di-GMP phosphodiesterase class II)
MKKHAEEGYRTAKNIPQLSCIADGILCHHEKWNGKGYPKGLKGEEIPILSRIISIVDAYDVMLTGRLYKKAMTKKEAIQELKENAGTQFDPDLIENFLKILKIRRKQSLTTLIFISSLKRIQKRKIGLTHYNKGVDKSGERDKDNYK